MSNHNDPTPAEMTCRDINDFLLAYHEGELDAQVRQRFEEHLGQCSSCVRFVEQYGRTIAYCRDAYWTRDAAVPPSVRRAVAHARRSVPR